MPGSMNLFDGQDLTASSEYSSRSGEHIDTLQIHHATTTSFSGLKALMDPGGRTVSANGAMSNEGYLDEVVPLAYRAFTSASGYDRRCLTVEVCNTTLGPEWGISEACRLRLARLAVDMFRAGILGGLNRQYIIGHYEVPGTYATACPGPDMHLDHIVSLANQIYSGAITAGGGTTPIQEDNEMTYALINAIPNETHLPGVPKGAVFVGNGTDPLVWVGNWGAEKVNGVVPAEWSAQQIADRIGQVGIRGSGANLNKVYSRFPREGDVPAYVLGAATVTVPPVEIGDVTVNVDYAALAKAIFDEQAARLQS